MGCIRLLERVKNLGWKKERYQQNCCKAGGISMASASILAECKHQNISPSMVFDYTSILPPLDVLNTISSIVFCLTSYHKNEKWAEALIISRFVWARNLDSLARLPLICSKNLAWKISPSFSGQLLLLRTSPSLPDTPVGGKTGQPAAAPRSSGRIQLHEHQPSPPNSRETRWKIRSCFFLAKSASHLSLLTLFTLFLRTRTPKPKKHYIGIFKQ